MNISFTLIDDEQFETATGLDKNSEIYCLHGYGATHTVIIHGLASVLKTSHDNTHRESLKKYLLTTVYECIENECADSGVLECSYFTLAERVELSV